MIPPNPWEHQNAVKMLYSRCMEATCAKHEVTRMELDILLFLANNPRYHTAKEIVEVRYLSKSQVSASITLLERRGFLRKEYAENNRKTAYLRICDGARPIIADGQAAQERFIRILLRGFSPEERERLQSDQERILRNINEYWKGDTENAF